MSSPGEHKALWGGHTGVVQTVPLCANWAECFSLGRAGASSVSPGDSLSGGLGNVNSPPPPAHAPAPASLERRGPTRAHTWV